MSDTSVGILLLIVAGVMNANFALPMKFARKWDWEHTWLAWSVFALVLFPVLLSVLTVPDLGGVYEQAGWIAVATVCACGLGWGISQVFLGLAVDALGIGLAFAIILGISAAFGSIVTLLDKHADKLYTPAGMAVIIGTVLVIVGVGFCAAAGRRRESVTAATPRRISFLRGFSFCVIAGVGSALVGLGLEWGAMIVRAAKSAGADEIWRPDAIWLPLMVAGAIPNIVYCVYLIRRNRNRAKFKEMGTATHWLLAFVMAVLWFASTVIYGVSTVIMGSLGGAITWPVYMSLIVITASVVGFLSGEWKGTGRMPMVTQMIGVAILVAAIVVFSRAL